MFDDSNIIVGLEIGTSKVCAVVGELTADGALNIIGLGQARSRGVRKGEIVDPTQAEEDVRNAIVEAEQMADVEIRNVYLGVTGGHIRGFNNRGVHPVVSADREISEDDVQDVVKNAKAINLPAENNVIHAIRQHFFVDGQDGVTNPVGMLGSRLEVDVHVVHGNTNRLQNAIRLVKGLQLEVNDIVFNGLASSLALLTNEQKELGALVIDIGGGTTDYVVYVNGVIKHTGVLAIGGDHVSNDLALRPESAVEPRGETQDRTRLGHRGRTPSRADAHHHQRTWPAPQNHQRRASAAHHVAAARGNFPAHRAGSGAGGPLDYLRAGVFLTGGGARVPHIAKLAERVFQMPVSLGQTNSISGLKSALDQPEFAAAIGLVKFGSFKTRKRGGKSSLAQGIKGVFGKFLRPS